MRHGRPCRAVLCAALTASLSTIPATVQALTPRKPLTPLEKKAFFLPELYISSATAPLAEVLDRLPNAAAWREFTDRAGARRAPAPAFIDQRSGAATNIVQATPLLPGSGVGNQVTLAALEQRLGRSLPAVDAAVVAEAALAWVRAQAGLLGVDREQLGSPTAAAVTGDLWQVSIPQQFRGVPVRHARVVMTVSHGNVVVAGAQTWGNVALPEVTPRVSADEALAAGFAHAEGPQADDELVRKPQLEIVPYAPAQHQLGDRFRGPIGRGYGHRLVWTFVFARASEVGTWEVMVDAISGHVIALQDRNHYARRQFTGSVYPLTNTEVCPTPQTCGTMLPNFPMPFADTGFPAPRDFANTAGVYEYAGGAARMTLTGRYVHMVEGYSPVLDLSSPTGAIALGGLNGQHDETTPAGGQGPNNPAMRTAYYELNKMFEIGRGYLPGNDWVQGVGPFGANWLNAEVNLSSIPCNAFYDDRHGNLGFALSAVGGDGSVCRNTGEDTATLDHEWGHALDDNDAIGRMSNSSEGYADIAAIYRTQSSCIGHGSFLSNPDNCGTTVDGTGANVDESQNNSFPGGRYCTTDCSGVRDADWVKHNPAFPANAVDFVCRYCRNSSFDPGPCGKQTHCSSTPVRQAAWDLVARDLMAHPFNYDSQTAFIVGNKLFYQGSGNIGSWFACACAGGGLSHGCDADNGYMQWLAADDDNGNLADGTPHMTAIHAAFTRHGIACQALPPVDSGCAAGPVLSPGLTAAGGHFNASLSWNGVGGATRYWVFRTEGHAGCNYGKALIAEVAGLSYTDTEVAAGRPYHYNVVAAGSSPACFSRASNCASVTPTAGSFTVACSPATVTISGTGAASTTCTVRSTGGYASAVRLGCTGLPGGASCTAAPAEVTPAPNGTAAVTVTVRTSLTPPAPGSYPFKVRGTPSATPTSAHTASLTLSVPGPGELSATFDPARRAPSCGTTVGRSCDTGTRLVAGRGLAGGEPNAPNTIGAACADGEGDARDATSDRIRITSADGLPFAPGRTVAVVADVTAGADFASQAVDVFRAADADDPQWVLVATRAPSASGPQALTASYTLPAGATFQALRVQFRSGGGATACAPGDRNDRDDLVFAVARE